MPESTDSLTARPTTYRGVRMRSRLEAGFAGWLDREQIKWAYEPQCFAGERGQYLPDFRLDGITSEAGGPIYVEVKPTYDLERIVFQVMRTMEVIWESQPDSALVVASPNDLAFWSFPATTGWRWDVHVWQRCVGGCGGVALVAASADPFVEGPCTLCGASGTTILSPWAGKPYWMGA